MHRGLEVRPSQGLEVWRVDVASRARDGAVVCWHKGLEVCGRGDVTGDGTGDGTSESACDAKGGVPGFGGVVACETNGCECGLVVTEGGADDKLAAMFLGSPCCTNDADASPCAVVSC